MALGLKVNDSDNVATIFAEGVRTGDAVEIRDKRGNSSTVTALSDIPYGHKMALTAIPLNSPVIKYGEQLGLTTRAIACGEHVHVHNLASTRGRGDL